MSKAIFPTLFAMHAVLALATIGAFTGVVVWSMASGKPDTVVLYLTGLGAGVSLFAVLTLAVSGIIWALDSVTFSLS